jgi:hypothetical protein
MLNYLDQGGLVDTGWQVTIVVEIWLVFHSASPDRLLSWYSTTNIFWLSTQPGLAKARHWGHQPRLAFGLWQGQRFLDFRQSVLGAKTLHPLALEGPQGALTPGRDVVALFAARVPRCSARSYPSRSTSHRQSRSKSLGESLSKGRVWVVRVIGGRVIGAPFLRCSQLRQANPPAKASLRCPHL